MASNNSRLLIFIIVRHEIVQSFEDIVNLIVLVEAHPTPDFPDRMGSNGELCHNACED